MPSIFWTLTGRLMGNRFLPSSHSFSLEEWWGGTRLKASNGWGLVWHCGLIASFAVPSYLAQLWLLKRQNKLSSSNLLKSFPSSLTFPYIIQLIICVLSSVVTDAVGKWYQWNPGWWDGLGKDHPVHRPHCHDDRKKSHGSLPGCGPFVHTTQLDQWIQAIHTWGGRTCLWPLLQTCSNYQWWQSFTVKLSCVFPGVRAALSWSPGWEGQATEADPQASGSPQHVPCSCYLLWDLHDWQKIPAGEIPPQDYTDRYMLTPWIRTFQWRTMKLMAGEVLTSSQLDLQIYEMYTLSSIWLMCYLGNLISAFKKSTLNLRSYLTFTYKV